MTKLNNENLSPNFPKPTEGEIKKTEQRIKEQYDKVLPKSDLIRVVNLTKELNWWLKLEKDPSSRELMINDLAPKCREYFKEKYGKEATDDEAIKCAKDLLVTITENEKKRIGVEMTAIISKD